MRLALCAAALVIAGCKIDLDTRESPRACESRPDIEVCQEAASVGDDFAWIRTNIFATNCSGSACHSAPTGGRPPGGRIVLAEAEAYQTLMGGDGSGVMSEVAPGRRLVVPGNAEASYLFFLLRGVAAADGEPPFEEPPEDVGYMPQDLADGLCCEKIDAVGRWIEAGARPAGP